MYTERQWFPILVISTQLSRWTDIFFLTGSACPSKCKIYFKKFLDEFDLFVLMSYPQITRLQLTHAHKMYKHFSKALLKFRLPSKNHKLQKGFNVNIPQWKHSHVVWKLSLLIKRIDYHHFYHLRTSFCIWNGFNSKFLLPC